MVHIAWRKQTFERESSVRSADENDFVCVQLMENKRPDDGDASRKTGREESPSRDQPAEVEVSARTDEAQPEEEKQGNGPVRDEEDEEEELRRDRTASGNEEDKRSKRSAPAAEASDAGSSPPCPRQNQDKTSQRVDESSESLIHETSRLPSAGGLCSAPDGASPPVCDLQLSSEPMQKKKDDDDDAASSAGVGAESGISSLAVSPDMEADGNVFPANGGEPQTEAASGLSGSSVLSQQLTEVTFASFQSCTQMFHSESIRWTHQQSSAANEDTFGQEIEDSYHSYYDRLETQVSVSEQLDIRSSVTSVQVETHEKTSISVKKKEDSETEVDHERTEISIMEATMDTNEWITDGNAPLLPWMTPAPLHHPQTNQVPPDESSAPEVAPDVPPPTEVPQTGTLFADESMEHYKKVVAVQPMPQNVNVTFRVHYDTQSPYQTVALTGDHPDLGSWKGFVPLEKVEEGHWSAVVSLPADSHVEWKFVLLDKGEVCRWEECHNRLLDTGSGDDVLVHKWWGLA